MREPEGIRDLISRYGLEEDLENIIIPFTGKDGRKKRCFLLKRRFIRILYPSGQTADHPLAAVIEAIVRDPETPLSESLPFMHHEIETEEVPEPQPHPEATEAD